MVCHVCVACILFGFCMVDSGLRCYACDKSMLYNKLVQRKRKKKKKSCGRKINMVKDQEFQLYVRDVVFLCGPAHEKQIYMELIQELRWTNLELRKVLDKILQSIIGLGNVNKEIKGKIIIFVKPNEDKKKLTDLILFACILRR